MVEIRQIENDQMPAVQLLLATCKLPFEDVDLAKGDFIGLYDDRHLLGCGGIEYHGKFGLLRSVALSAELRGKKMGKSMVDYLEQLAQRKGLSALYLLTETASGFFHHQRYEVVPRSQVPDPIKSTSEFAHVCPTTATVMVKHLRQQS